MATLLSLAWSALLGIVQGGLAWILGRRRADTDYLREVAHVKDQQLQETPASRDATRERLRDHRF